MKFKLIEKFDETRSVVQDYMYDAMDELNNASLEEYIQWFKSELTYYDERVEQAVKDAYIEACDYGMIKGVEKTRLTSELKEYIESNSNLLDNVDELMNNCPEHLRHELQLALYVAELNESLNEELLTESPEDHKFIYEARFKTPTGEYELFTDDYNSFSKMMYKYYVNNEDPEVLIHVIELGLKGQSELKFINKDLTVPNGSSARIIDSNTAKITNFKELAEVIRHPCRRTAEENKILPDKPLTDTNRLLMLWKECHDSDYNINRLNNDFMEIEITPENKKERKEISSNIQEN